MSLKTNRFGPKDPIDYLKKAGKSIVFGPAGVLIKQGGDFIKNQLAGNIRPYAYNTKGSSTVERIAKSILDGFGIEYFLDS